MSDHTIDAKGKILGRLATEIATILQGKHRPDYAPNRVSEDRVLVKNVDKITVTGNKMDNRIYYRHTGYMGHLKEETMGERFAKDPRKLLREAVRRMLPKNFLNTKRLNNMVFVTNDAAVKKSGPAKEAAPAAAAAKSGAETKETPASE